MSIDTEDKRRSVVSPGLPYLVIVPKPDGTINADDRRHIAGFYRGIKTDPAAQYKISAGMFLGVYNND